MSLRYVSTRGTAPVLDFKGVVLAGLAADGGLYVPESWPAFAPTDFASFRGARYQEVALRVLEPFVGDALDRATLARLIEESYATFTHAAVAPLRQIAADEWLLELFHGPTLAFKDIALQLLGRLMDYFLAQARTRLVVVGATSGDTGSAAIAACQDRAAIEIFILHPKGRVSDVQRRQMTTVTATNVHNLAVEGTFDDCQALVKRLFADRAFAQRYNLGAVNSINWARIVAQTVYYVTAAVALGAPERGITFAVPTGNFGDVYAGYCAHRIGLPIQRLVIATNRNDILARLLATGEYRPAGVIPTLSPSMDIQVASNFERLLFELYDRDGARVAATMNGLAQSGSFALDGACRGRAQAIFSAAATDEESTLATIRAVADTAGVVVDPHTAVAIAAGRRVKGTGAGPLVHLATAHPAKFPDAVQRALGRVPEPPPAIAALAGRPERYATIANDIAALTEYVRTHV